MKKIETKLQQPQLVNRTKDKLSLIQMRSALSHQQSLLRRKNLDTNQLSLRCTATLLISKRVLHREMKKSSRRVLT